jgi:hypothetical protein
MAGRPKGSKNKLTDNGKSEKLAPGDCPYRASRTRMYVWWCKTLCKEYDNCPVWREE